MARPGWSSGEVRATVADYFEMLRRELAGQPYNKAGHRRRLLDLLDGRSAAAVERKHQNISAILLEEDLAAIDGYKPLGNYQGALRDEVVEALKRDAGLLTLIQATKAAVPPEDVVHTLDPEHVMVPRPEPREISTRRLEKNWNLAVRSFDFELRDEQNRRLGQLGEEFVFRFEKNRLTKQGRADLAKKVDWISHSLGDGAGFDVLSWDASEQELFIEVKTTNLSRYQPFLISRGEVAFSSTHADRYSLYRVFHFSRGPKLFRLNGSVETNARLEPLTFEGRL